MVVDKGVVTITSYTPPLAEEKEDPVSKSVFDAIAAHRHFTRDTSSVPA